MRQISVCGVSCAEAATAHLWQFSGTVEDAMEAKLVVVGGKANKAEVKLKLPTMVGRGRDADLTVAHATVSRHHCLIYELEGALVVRDNGSLNGTVVEGERVQEAVLKPGQSLTIGPLTFRAEYDHQGGFPVLGSLPDEAIAVESDASSNGEAVGHGFPKIETSKAAPARRAAPPAKEETIEEQTVEAAADAVAATSPAAAPVEPDEAPSDSFDFLDDAPAEPASSAPSFSFLTDSNDASDGPHAANGSRATASSDIDDELALPVDLPSDESADEAADGFSFLQEEPTDTPAAPGPSGASDEQGEEVFQLADEPSAVAERDVKSKRSGREPSAKTEQAKPAKAAAAAEPAEEHATKAGTGDDDAALDDFLNSLGLDE